MGYNLQGMSDYAKSNGIVLIKDLILQAQSFSMDGIRVETGIKSTELFADFSIGSGSTVIQATNGDAGALSYSGGSTLKDISIHVIELAIKERYVKSTLESKIAQMQMRAGSDPSNPLPYADVLVNLKAQTVGHINDLLIWQGDTTGATNNVIDGYLTRLKASSGATAYVAATGVTIPFTQTTAIASVEAFVKQGLAAFPVWILDGAYLYMSPTNFEIYFRAVYGLSSPVNTLTLELNARPIQKFMVPGTNVEVLSTNGLVANNSLVMTREFNLCLGTDLVSEDDTLSFEYLNEQQIWRLFGAYKLGTKIARTQEVVAAIA